MGMMLHERRARVWQRFKPVVLLTSIAIALLLMALILMGMDRLYPLHLPGEEGLFARVVVDNQGRPLRAFAGENGVWRYQVSLDEISPLYLEALLTYEDKRFWQHPGVDPIALGRSAFINLKAGRVVTGGSTISMQVARLLHPHSRSLAGKLYQMLRTLQLEWHLSKEAILTLYCNIAPFGGTIEGVQAASFTYLNKPVSQLTHAEAALLAVLPQSPTRFRPDLHPEAAQQARNKVLQRMVARHRWSLAVVEDARLETVYAVHNRIEQHAPLLARRLMSRVDLSSERVIRTTIDGTLQAALEDVLSDYIAQQDPNSTAAVLVMDNATHSVLAYLGTARFGDARRLGHVDMIEAIRSPGSTLKPFLYAMALDEGLIHEKSMLSDAPMHWQEFHPSNFTGGFSGPVSAAEALQRSLNIPAVQLLDKVGPNTFAARLQNAGLKVFLPEPKPNLAMILGGGGVRLEALVQSYMALANEGLTYRLRFTRDDVDEPGRYLMSPQAAWVIYQILQGIDRPGSLRNTSSLAHRGSLAWKTGTSYGFRDAWAIGVDRDYTIGVWIGRADGTPVPASSGRQSAGPLLHTIADYLPHSRQAIPQPAGLEQQTICWPLGTLESEQSPEHCLQRHKAWIVKGTVPPTFADTQSAAYSNPFVYWQDTLTALRVNGMCLPEHYQRMSVALWPLKLEPWVPFNQRRRGALPKMAADCLLDAQGSGQLKIEGIAAETVLRSVVGSSEPPSIHLRAIGGQGVYYWYINGRFLQRARGGFVYTFAGRGKFEISVVDDAGNTDRAWVQVI